MARFLNKRDLLGDPGAHAGRVIHNIAVAALQKHRSQLFEAMNCLLLIVQTCLKAVLNFHWCTKIMVTIASVMALSQTFVSKAIITKML